MIPHVSESAKKQVSFDYLNSRVSLCELKNKLIKMTNLTINLLRFRSSADPDALNSAVKKLISLQGHRFLVLLKTIRKIYGIKHSACAISRTVVTVFKFSAKLVSIPEFFTVSAKEFSLVFKNTEFHSVFRKISAYLDKLDN